MRKVMTILLGLTGLMASIQIASARACSDVYLECTNRAGNSYGAGSAAGQKAQKVCTSKNTQCMKDGSWGGSEKGAYEKRLVKDNVTWNGKTTTIVTTDSTGTHTTSYKQGVPTETGMMVLGPDGHRYAPWDPKLGALLESKGYKDSQGNPQGFSNAKAMRNEIALKRDAEIRTKIFDNKDGKKGPLVLPQPTGTRNRDALGNAAPKVNDHRDEKPKTSSTSSNTPPAAAAPGTASTTAVTNPAAQGGTRDHRKGGSSGGVTVTQTPKSSSGQGDRGGKDRQRH